MKTVGIIAEYNPLHLGHKGQFDRIRQEFGPDTAIVCAMSGNYVQRGEPAVLDKTLRASAAVACGADLVVELPTTVSLSSAEGFASGGVGILSQVCDTLCFGAETADPARLTQTARALLSPGFPSLLRQELDKGLSFPAARAAALAQMGQNAPTLPNDILAVEYCKAILVQNSPLVPFPILREGSYHAQAPDARNPSATAVRRLLLAGGGWQPYVPESARAVFAGGKTHALAAGERAILARLRVMTEGEFEALPYGGEGLWRKLMRVSRECATLEALFAAVKSKRYTRTRLNRMVMCAFLGISVETLSAPAPYVRVLAFNEKGRAILSAAKKSGFFRNAGQSIRHPYQELERRWGDLYGLFCTEAPETPGAEQRRRVVFEPKNAEREMRKSRDA
ncbi:MAG: nucleotidyltransferase family protein [Firmicutes bacterium]|nr:nucleotidyltransferase family protein [Bacillota bacterium]